ncbi:excisionase family DNA-binding protein [Thiomicrospira sp. ALE5]|uniref:excisionase family DNA-binding protein n=1 Tax=Thiomicrospira sp. ALE5 TaxID=748650 RepID=UPI0008E441BA|nr:excisionase family DNA-binding protein [Thiomicrospira sp. ALE5]SFR48731.1 DNA binding domain-containing protein, excisionase family [Thiomicrospira sp. ALE5]
MATKNTKHVTTTEACNLIGVSKTVIKRLADEGVLKIWKTPGGHRRLLRSSVDDYIMKNGRVYVNGDDETLKVLVVCNDKALVSTIENLANKLTFSITTLVVSDEYQALIMAGKYIPEIILFDLNEDHDNIYKVIEAIQTHQLTKNATIISMSDSATADVKREGLPQNITVMHKPVQPDILKQFLTYEYNLKKT